ncbi:putative nonaspanin (TM9SF) [Helianthus annuus]|nr:putative nonaspanin (TM9SF) [Helianthus annuus]
MIVLSISGMVAMIMLRTLHRDIFEYDHLDNLEEAQEQTGWKLVHTDIFRPPNHLAFWLEPVYSYLVQS